MNGIPFTYPQGVGRNPNFIDVHLHGKSHMEYQRYSPVVKPDELLQDVPPVKVAPANCAKKMNNDAHTNNCQTRTPMQQALDELDSPYANSIFNELYHPHYEDCGAELRFTINAVDFYATHLRKGNIYVSTRHANLIALISLTRLAVIFRIPGIGRVYCKRVMPNDRNLLGVLHIVVNVLLQAAGDKNFRSSIQTEELLNQWFNSRKECWNMEHICEGELICPLCRCVKSTKEGYRIWSIWKQCMCTELSDRIGSKLCNVGIMSPRLNFMSPSAHGSNDIIDQITEELCWYLRDTSTKSQCYIPLQFKPFILQVVTPRRFIVQPHAPSPSGFTSKAQQLICIICFKTHTMEFAIDDGLTSVTLPLHASPVVTSLHGIVRLLRVWMLNPPDEGIVDHWTSVELIHWIKAHDYLLVDCSCPKESGRDCGICGFLSEDSMAEVKEIFTEETFANTLSQRSKKFSRSDVKGKKKMTEGQDEINCEAKSADHFHHNALPTTTARPSSHEILRQSRIDPSPFRIGYEDVEKRAPFMSSVTSFGFSDFNRSRSNSVSEMTLVEVKQESPENADHYFDIDEDDEGLFGA